MKRILGVLTLVLVVSALIIGCSKGKSSSPKDVVDKYHSLLKSGKIEKAMALTTYSDEEIKQQVEKYEGLKFELKSYEILSEEIAEDGKTAKVKVKTTFTSTMAKDVKEQEDSIELELIDGIWKIKD
ncbi:MAG: hypothetical protein RBT05_09895 [Bacteroidales bacterium]|jgi:hypothetical protein|nr:hypothetical protein [Bacteroidales bacterium]